LLSVFGIPFLTQQRRVRHGLFAMFCYVVVNPLGVWVTCLVDNATTKFQNKQGVCRSFVGMNMMCRLVVCTRMVELCLICK